MKYKISILLSVCIGLVFMNCKGYIECKEGINLLPMYGKVPKCKQQLMADETFLAESDKNEPDRAKAAIGMMDTGWYYIHQKDYDNAMKRMNQAWLLDSTNIAIYSSFIVILDLTQKTDDAIQMLDLTLDKINARDNPVEPSATNLSNQVFIEFITANASFAYRKNNSIRFASYLYEKIEDLKISSPEKEILRDKLKTDIPEIN